MPSLVPNSYVLTRIYCLQFLCPKGLPAPAIFPLLRPGKAVDRAVDKGSPWAWLLIHPCTPLPINTPQFLFISFLYTLVSLLGLLSAL